MIFCRFRLLFTTSFFLLFSLIATTSNIAAAAALPGDAAATLNTMQRDGLPVVSGLAGDLQNKFTKIGKDY